MSIQPEPTPFRCFGLLSPWPRWLLICLLAGWLCACAGPSPEVKLSFQVKPTAQSNEFRLLGHSNLPDGTVAAVEAIRYLQPPDPSQEPPIYSILDRKNIRLSGGRWETQLKLRQTAAADGLTREAWQGPNSQPVDGATVDPQVQFQLTILSTGQPPEVARYLGRRFVNVRSQALAYGDDGEAYLRAERRLPVPMATVPPTRTAAIGVLPQPVPVTVGPALFTLPQSNAPLSADYRLR